MAENIALEDIGKVHVTILKLIGLIPFEKRSLDYLPTILLTVFIHVSHTICTTAYWSNITIRFLRGDEIGMEVVVGCSGMTGLHVRFLILYFKRDKMARIRERCKLLWEGLLDDEERAAIRYFTRQSGKIAYAYLAQNAIMILQYLVASQIPKQIPNTNQTVAHTMPYAWYTDDVIYKSPAYEISAVVQMVAITGACFASAAVDNAPPFFIMIACGHLRVLGRRLEERRTGVRECAIYHQEIMELCKDIERLSGTLFMVQLLATSYNMALLGLKVIGNEPDKFKHLNIIIIMMIQLYICNWAPEKLVHESEKIKSNAYLAAYILDSDRSVRSTIKFLILRSQQPIQMVVGGHIALSMETFGSIVKSVASFFMVLRNFT